MGYYHPLHNEMEKNMDQILAKGLIQNLNNKHEQILLHSTKKFATDALATTPKRII